MKQGILKKVFQREYLNSPHFYPQFLFQPQIPVSSITGKFARMWQLLPQHTLVKVYEVQTDLTYRWRERASGNVKRGASEKRRYALVCMSNHPDLTSSHLQSF